jgi:hypothetical protein
MIGSFGSTSLLRPLSPFELFFRGCSEAFRVELDVSVLESGLMALCLSEQRISLFSNEEIDALPKMLRGI